MSAMATAVCSLPRPLFRLHRAKQKKKKKKRTTKEGDSQEIAKSSAVWFDVSEKSQAEQPVAQDPLVAAGVHIRSEDESPVELVTGKSTEYEFLPVYRHGV